MQIAGAEDVRARREPFATEVVAFVEHAFAMSPDRAHAGRALVPRGPLPR